MPRGKLLPKDADPFAVLNSLDLAAAYLQAGGAITGSGNAMSYANFQRTYQLDPVGFALNCIEWQEGEGLTEYQKDVIAALASNERASVRMVRGGGKSFILALFVLWFALTRDGEPWRIGTTAGSWSQLKNFLWPEIHKWARRVKWSVVGRDPFDERYELQQMRLNLKTGFAYAAASNKPGLLEGLHEKHVAYVFDEAKSIPDTTFDAAEGSFSEKGRGAGAERHCLVFSTPGAPSGRFWDIHSHKHGMGNWWTRHVTIQEALDQGQIRPEWVEDTRSFYGETSTYFKQQVLAEFASDDKDAVIPLSWVEAAVERWREWDELGRPGDYSGLGLDVGAGGDTTVMACLFGNAIAELHYLPKTDDTMAAAARVIEADDRYTAGLSNDQRKLTINVIDVIGVGTGIVDRLRECGRRVDAFNAQNRSGIRDLTGTVGFVNRRAEAWWRVRELLDPRNTPTLCLPPDDRLIGDLVTPKYRILTGPVGKVQIESKDVIRRAIGRSTDAGDAVVMILASRKSGFTRAVEELKKDVFDCPRCGNPAYDFGDTIFHCPHCGNNLTLLREKDEEDGESVVSEAVGVSDWTDPRDAREGPGGEDRGDTSTDPGRD